MLLENAHDVGDLLAIIWAGPAPADNDPLTDVGRGEPDLEPVAHAGHLFRGAAPGAAVGLATTPSAAGDVAGEVVGVIGQRAGLGSAAGRSELAGEPDVLGGELGPLAGHVLFAEDRPDRAHRLAGAAAGALTGRMQSIRSPSPMHGSVITYVIGGCPS
jgi:hypothetical protein